MAYASGTASSPNDLLDKIRLFATGSCGYTEALYTADAGYFRLHLTHPSGGGQVVNLHSYASYLTGYPSTDFDALKAYASQTVAGSSAQQLDVIAGGAVYRLYGGDGWCYCVLNTRTTLWGLLAFGAIEKSCSFTGGAFFGGFNTGGYPSSLTHLLRADIGGMVKAWRLCDRGGDVGGSMFESSPTRNVAGNSYAPIDLTHL